MGVSNLERNVQRLHRMRQSADGNEIDPRLGNRPNVVECNAAGRFDFNAVGYQR